MSHTGGKAHRAPLDPSPRRFVRAHAAQRRAGVGPLHTGFLSHQRLADLFFCRRLRRVGAGLVEADGDRFTLQQAVRVIERDGGGPDRRGLSGMIRPLEALRAAGAVIAASEMSLDSETYRIERGVIVVRRPAPRQQAPSSP